MSVRPMIFVWQSPDRRMPKMLPSKDVDGTPSALVPVPGIRVDVSRDGLCWGRHPADPRERYWRVREAGAVALGAFEPGVVLSVRDVVFERRRFRCDGRDLDMFVAPGVDVSQIEAGMNNARDWIKQEQKR